MEARKDDTGNKIPRKSEQEADDGQVAPPREEDSISPPIPPDGGYGWVIMIASFMASLILDGVCFSFGIFYMEFLEYFQESKAKTSWVGSVLNGMYLSMGPIVSGLSNKFGCRAVAITGSFIAACSFILSTYSPNVDVLIFTYGCMGGFGFGLMYLPAIVMVGFYFEKRRALATGVAVCGSGIGAFVFAPMCERLLAIYDWKGATWIIAGIVLNGCVLGALYRPLKPQKKPLKYSPKICKEDEETCKNLIDTCHEPNMDNAVLYENEASNHPRNSTCQNGTFPRRKQESDKSKLVHRSLLNLSKEAACVSVCASRSCGDISTRRGTHEKDLSRPLYRKDIFYSGSIQQLPQYKEAASEVDYVRSVTKLPQSPAVGGSSAGWCGRSAELCRSLTDTVREMLDFSLLTNIVFCIYGISCFLCMAGFYIPFTYLPHHAVKNGLTREQAAFLLSIIGIANTVARVLCGWVSDQSWADCLVINNLALMMAGLATILCPFCYNYGLMAAYSAVFGVGIAVFVSLRSIIMVELMGLDRLTSAFGLVTMCQGLSAFIGAPIAGALYNIMGTYNLSFYMAGTTLFLAGAICLPLRRIARWQKLKHEKTNNAMMNLQVQDPSV